MSSPTLPVPPVTTQESYVQTLISYYNSMRSLVGDLRLRRIFLGAKASLLEKSDLVESLRRDLLRDYRQAEQSLFGEIQELKGEKEFLAQPNSPADIALRNQGTIIERPSRDLGLIARLFGSVTQQLYKVHPLARESIFLFIIMLLVTIFMSGSFVMGLLVAIGLFAFYFISALIFGFGIFAFGSRMKAFFDERRDRPVQKSGVEKEAAEPHAN